jgi:hypothetical protein
MDGTVSIQMHFLKFSFIVVLGGGTLWHLQKFVQCLKYIILEFTLSSGLLYPSSPDSLNSFNRYHFCTYIHVYTFLHHIHPPLLPTFSAIPPPTGANIPPRAGPVYKRFLDAIMKVRLNCEFMSFPSLLCM